MRIIYDKRTKSESKILKKKITRLFECLLLVFVMSIFSSFLMMKNMKRITVSEEYKEVNLNPVFDVIELELPANTDAVEERNETMDQTVDLKQIFNNKQRQSNGKGQ